jgi:hypothetical protein
LEVRREPVDESYADTAVYDADETVTLRGHSLSVSELLP